jgi:hypothetical protein
VASALSCVVGVATFSRALGFEFAYDDEYTIVHNGWLKTSPGTLAKALVGFRGGGAALPDVTRPVMIVSTWMDRHLVGLSPWGYHLHSLLLYGATCALAVLALLPLVGRVRAALVGGLFFAIAPVHAEAVAAINYREDLLAAIGVFVPLAVLFGRAPCRPRNAQIVAVAAALAVGLFAKESAIAVVPMALVVAAMRRVDRAWLRERRPMLAALAGVLAVWSVWRISLRVRGLDDIPLAASRGWDARLLATARYEVLALFHSVVPVTWSPEYAAQPPASGWWLVAAAGTLVGVVVLALGATTRILGYGLALVLVAALPTSPLVGPFNEQADRFLFLSVLGAGVVWGWAGDHALRRLPKPARPFALVTALLPLAVVAQSATSVWASDLTLWSAATSRAPSSPRAWSALARAERRDGALDRADAAVERALGLDPSYVPAHVTRLYDRIARADRRGAEAELETLRALHGEQGHGMRRALDCLARPDAELASCIQRP